MKLFRRFLCVITDEHRSPIEQAEMAIEGGARMIQLRNKKANGRDLFLQALRLQELCRSRQTILIINDRVDIALAMQADGVHLGQHDLPARAARSLLGADAVIGVSVSNAEEARQAEADGADYIGLGHIFPTLSKEKSSPPLGILAISEVKQAVSLPLVAIGGITLDKIPEVIRAGASGIAVISAVSRAVDPTLAARNMVREIDRSRC